MGQQVAVIEKPSPRPGVLRFETNRSLTGMGHERVHLGADAIGPRPAAALARQLLSTGKVDSVYVYGNIVSVDIAKGFNSERLWPTWSATCTSTGSRAWRCRRSSAPEEEAAPVAAAGDSGGAVESAYTRLVPELLRDRSAAALAKWQASQ